MGSECYQVWKSLRGDREAQEQYVQWIMFLADNLAPFQKRANNKKSGPYFDLKEGHYRRHTVQMAMRGKARDVSMEGVAGAMRLILVQNLDRFLRNKEVMVGHRRGGDRRCVVMSIDIGSHKIPVTIFHDPYAKKKDDAAVDARRDARRNSQDRSHDQEEIAVVKAGGVRHRAQRRAARFGTTPM